MKFWGLLLPPKGSKLSADTRLKISLAKQGKVSSMKGIKRSPEFGLKIQFSWHHRGPVSEVTRRKQSLARKRRKLSVEHRLAISSGNRGHIVSEETRAKLRQSSKLQWATTDIRSKIVASNTYRSGSNHHGWHGGVSKDGYHYRFNKQFKIRILLRDWYQCQMCGESGNNVHHIFYDKSTNNCSNLLDFVTLCVSCNSKANGRWQRQEWPEILLGMLREEFHEGRSVHRV